MNTPAPQVEIQLPELPEPWLHLHSYGDCYSAGQMRVYAIELAQAALNARAGGDAKDAERYRGLVNNDWLDPANQPAALTHAFSRYTGSMLDAVVDAALASQAVGVKDGR